MLAYQMYILYVQAHCMWIFSIRDAKWNTCITYWETAQMQQQKKSKKKREEDAHRKKI